VCVHDLRPEVPRRANCIAGESEVSSPSAGSPIDHRPLELVPAGCELALEVGHEDPQVGIVRAGVHLRDEEDSHQWINRDVFGTVS